MAADCGIYITYTYIEKSLLFIDQLLECGWSVNDHGKIMFLPLHDNDDFNWQFQPLDDWHLIYSLLKEKINANETVGLSLTFESTDIGCVFLFNFNQNHIIISVSINRKKIYNTDITDFSWYLDRLKPILSKYVEKIECTDIYL